MDKNEQFPLRHIPERSLSLRLARPTIKMRHNASWTIDKVNPVHDLIICMSGIGRYRLVDGEEPITLQSGDAMMIPAYTRFRGGHGGGEGSLLGIAQHFTLDLFGRGDAIQQMQLKRAVALPDWDSLQHLATSYRTNAPQGSTTLIQHHQFMVLLLSYLETAFEGWRTKNAKPDRQDQLSMQIMFVASRLSADPSGSGVEEALRNVPYNPDYFRRAFRDRIGMTPQKFREQKRMEFAASRLGMGLSVKEAAAELGFADPYFFSRMFKRHLGASPSTYRDRSAMASKLAQDVGPP